MSRRSGSISVGNTFGCRPLASAGRTVLRGEPGSRRDVVLLNAGAAFVAAGTVETLDEGVERAALTIDAGLTAELLERLRAERRAVEATTTAAGASS